MSAGKPVLLARRPARSAQSEADKGHHRLIFGKTRK
jgi:hypothetical protein